MSIYTKRNAAVGYIALKVASRAFKRGRRRRSGLKLSLYVALGLISFGILAGVAAVLLRRQQGESETPEGAGSSDEAESEIVGEYVTAATEPIPAT